MQFLCLISIVTVLKLGMGILLVVMTDVKHRSTIAIYELQGTIKNVHIKRNFTITVASCISVIMPGDFKVVCIKQVFCFNSVCINEVPLYVDHYLKVSTIL